MIDDFRDDSEHDVIAARLLLRQMAYLDYLRRSSELTLLVPTPFEVPAEPEFSIHIRVPAFIDCARGAVLYLDCV